MIDIPSIQKRKFLNNVYKALYAKGVRPNEEEVRRLFSSYFSVNKLGSPVSVNFGDLERDDVIDVDLLNSLMGNTLLNVEVLYDLIWENNNEILSVTTALNNRLEYLRSKRKELESTVDQLIFSNENSDGFFYSFLDTFSSVDNIDLNLSTGYVDINNGYCTIPTIITDISSAVSSSQIMPAAAKFSKILDGQRYSDSVNAEGFDVVFDGLTDTYWSDTVEASQPSVASIVLDIPLNTSISISKIDLRLVTISPCSVGLTLTPVDSTLKNVNIIKNSTGDYDKYSFAVPTGRYSSMRLTLFKTEPDEILQAALKPYIYRFGVSELMIGSEYHEKKGIIVSSPLSLPRVDNSTLEISTVAVDADVSSTDDTTVKFYVAKDIEGAQSISDFNWYAIEPSSFGDGSAPTSVSFISSNLKTVYFNSSNSPFTDVNVDNTSSNVNDHNPVPVPYATEKSAYRFKVVPSSLDVISPFILSGINGVRSYFSYSSDPSELYKSVTYWLNEVKQKNVAPDFIKDQSVVLNSIRASGSGFLTFKFLCENDIQTIQTVVKSSLDFNLSIYLNGNLISDLPSGNLSGSIEWNFIKGVNNVQIGYDNFTNFDQTVSIMSGVSLSEFGTVYLDYFNYLDPIEFRRRPFDSLNAFTIQNLYGQKQILSSKVIQENSLIKYYSNVSDIIDSVRYRIDMFRGLSSPLTAPYINSLRVKFRHNDSQE